MIVRLGGRGYDCNQFLVKDPKANRFDLVDAGHGLDFDRVLAEVRQHIDPARIGTVYATHEHFDHVGGLVHWKALGARIAASAPCADKLREGRDPTSEAFGASIPRLDVDDVLSDADVVEIGGIGFTCIAAPGHCPGALCYHDADAGTLFSGDVLFAQGGIGRFDFPDSDPALHLESIRRLARLEVRALHCGHGPSVEGEAAAASVQASLNNASSYISP